MRTPVRFVLGSLFVLVAAGGVRAEDLLIDAPIRSVTVYQDRALVDRSAETRIPAGEHRLIVSGLSAAIAADSVRPSVPPGVTILDTRVDRVHGSEAAHAEARTVEAELRRIQEEIRGLQAEAEAREAQRTFLASIRVASGDAARQEGEPRRFDAEAAAAALVFLRERLEALRKAEGVATEAMRDARARLEAAKRRLGDLGQGRERLTHLVSVWIRTDGAEGTVGLSYLASNAGWTPRYDFRADADAKSVTIGYLGEVRQETGEDWTGVALTLSTARPAEGASPAGLDPLYLTLPRPMPETAVAARFAAPAAPPAGAMEEGEGLMREKRMQEEPAPTPVAVPERRGTTVAFVIPRPESVASGEGAKRVTIAEEAVPTVNHHYISPRVAPTAWLRSTVKNPFAFPMLSGAARVYFGPDYVGATAIEDVVKGDDFDLYLGSDPQVKVERELVERTSSRHGLFSRTRRIAYRYRTVVENLRGDAIEVTLLDREPMSRDEQIVVTRTAVVPPPSEPATDEEKTEAERGLLQWRQTVAAGDRYTQELGYTVEWPEDKIVVGLE